jgi:hypothetical protein
LTFGALVNELCQHKTQKVARQSVFGAQSGFADQEQCPSNKKQQYKQASDYCQSELWEFKQYRGGGYRSFPKKVPI